MLEESGPEISLPRQRFLRLRLIQRYLSLKDEQKVKSLGDQALSNFSSDTWNPGEKYFLGYQMLAAQNLSLIPSSYLQQIQALLADSFKRWSGEEKADKAFLEILELVERGEGRPVREYWGMFEQIAELSPQSYGIPEMLGNHYVNKGRSLEKINRALVLFGQAEANLNKIPANDQPRVLAWLDLNKGYAYMQLIKYGDADQRRQNFQNTEKLLRPLLEKIPPQSKGWPDLKVVYGLLIEANTWANNIDEAARLNEEGLKRFPDDGSLQENKFIIDMARMRPDLAVELAKQLAEGPERDETYVIFHTALAEFLTNHKDFEYSARRFIYTDHPYRDYFRMMLYCCLVAQKRPDEAQELLNERWRTIVPETWEGRLKKGDANVWREMLIGYYAGKVDKKEIFDPLKDRPTFERSPLGQVGLLYPEVYSEAYFYDALLQGVSGDPATRRQRQLAGWQKVVEAQYIPSFEYRLSVYLIKQHSGESK